MDRRGLEAVLTKLDETVIGLDEQTRQLTEVCRRWISTRKGDSCIITGHRGSGRTTVIDKVLTKTMEKHGDIEKNVLYVAQLGSDVTAQQVVSGDEQNPRVVVIEDADELITRQRQTLLYSLLDATRRMPWLVILMVNRIDFVNSLEKRVRSRLSTNKIVFTGVHKYEDYQKGFESFLSFNCKDRDSKQFLDSFIKSREVQSELKYMYQVTNSYGLLKMAVALFLGWMMDSTNTLDEAVTLWKAAVDSVTPSTSPVQNLLSGISLRSFCVFLCVLRRLEKAPSAATITYRKVLVDYKQLCNTADKRMTVGDDSTVYKELDQLVKMRILHADVKSNNISFRRISLNVSALVLSDAMKSVTIPVHISEWFKTIPQN